MTTAAVVLAAGGGSRFSAGPKLLAPFRGRPLVACALDAAIAAGLDDTIVVVGDTPLDDVVPAGVIVVTNAGWAEGIATSLCAAVHAAATAVGGAQGSGGKTSGVHAFARIANGRSAVKGSNKGLQ